MSNIRINLELPAQYRERMKRLQTTTGATTQAEVFRKAIGLLEIVTQIKADGGTLKVTRADGTTETLLLIS